MKKNIALLFSCIITFGFAQVKTRNYIVDPLTAPRERNVDFTNMKLDVSFDTKEGIVKGKVTHDFIPLRQKVDSIFLDGIKMKVEKIVLNGKDAKYRLDSAGITVFANPALAWETKNSMTITYQCTPRKGLYFVGWNDPNNISRKQIWSQGQGIDNRHWIPMYDEMNDRIISEVIVTFDKDYQVLSNGAKVVEKLNSEGTKTWHYKMSHSHAPYLVMLGIGKYGIKETKSKSGVPMHLYYYPEWKNRVEATYKYSENMMDFFENEIGVKYGWESYSQIPVQEFMFGAMENTTATVYGDFFLVDERGYLDRYYVGVNAHELAHQWFGDLITARSDAHHWLQESFATYYNEMYEREVNGKDFFDMARRGAQTAAINEAAKNKLPVAHSEAGGVRHYPQGAFVINMLKYVSGGRVPYNKAIKYYLEKHKYQNVDSRDLLLAFEETSGMSLDWFWEEWIEKGGLPDYKVSFTEKDGVTEFNVKQRQELSDITGLSASGKAEANSVSAAPFVSSVSSAYRPAGLFKMPIWFEVHYTDGSVDKKQAWIENLEDVVTVPNPSKKKIDFVLFDPNDEVLKSVSFEKSFEMLKSQAMKAESILDRLDAIEAMRSMSMEKKRDFLISVFSKEKFNAVKTEIISQLANNDGVKNIELLKIGLNDKDVVVRKAVLNNQKTIPVILLPDFERLLTDSSYEIIMNTLDKLYMSNPVEMPKYLALTKGVTGNVGRNLEIKWMELSVASANDQSSLTKLVDYTSNSYEFRTRVNAMQALKKLDYFDEKLLTNLLDAIPNANTRLGDPAGEALKYFYTQDKYRKMIKDYVASHEWKPWELVAIRKIVE